MACKQAGDSEKFSKSLSQQHFPGPGAHASALSVHWRGHWLFLPSTPFSGFGESSIWTWCSQLFSSLAEWLCMDQEKEAWWVSKPHPQEVLCVFPDSYWRLYKSACIPKEILWVLMAVLNNSINWRSCRTRASLAISIIWQTVTDPFSHMKQWNLTTHKENNAFWFPCFPVFCSPFSSFL